MKTLNLFLNLPQFFDLPFQNTVCQSIVSLLTMVKAITSLVILDAIQFRA